MFLLTVAAEIYYRGYEKVCTGEGLKSRSDVKGQGQFETW